MLKADNDDDTEVDGTSSTMAKPSTVANKKAETHNSNHVTTAGALCAAWN